MITYPNIDPILLDLGLVQIRWYGVSYVLGILLAWTLLKTRKQKKPWNFTNEQVSDLVFYCMIGIIIGGRLGSVLFYNFSYYIQNPIEILYLNRGGMSFHGGLIGVLISIYIFSKRIKCNFFHISDFIAPTVPVGLFFGRIANFINSELWGKPTDLPWGMVFPNAGNIARHPSQLYEAFLEGVLLFIIIWWFSTKRRPTKAISGLFLVAYGIFRFIVEFVRIPDNHIGYIAFNWLTIGQLLSIPMVIFGAFLIIRSYKT